MALDRVENTLTIRPTGDGFHEYLLNGEPLTACSKAVLTITPPNIAQLELTMELAKIHVEAHSVAVSKDTRCVAVVRLDVPGEASEDLYAKLEEALARAARDFLVDKGLAA